MRIIFFRIIIIVFWLLMTGWLVRYEAFPEKFTDAVSGYRAIFQRGPMIVDSWMQIESQDLPIGYSHTWIDTNLEDEKTAYTVRNQTVLNFKIMGQNQWVGVTADAVLDDDYILQKFSAVMVSSIYSMRVDAQRRRKGVFEVTMKTPAAAKSFEMEIPDNVVLYSSMSDMAMKQLAPGKSIRLKTIDPVSLSVADVVIQAVRRETIMHDGKKQESTLLKILWQGMSVSAWIDDDGRVLREETPFGWVMKASTPRAILSRRRHAFEGADLFASMAVPLRGELNDSCQRIKARLNGRLSELDGLESHRQTVAERHEDFVILDLVAQKMPAVITRLGEKAPPETHQFLASSFAVQSDNDEIIKQAQQISAVSRDSYEAAVAINEWVYRNIVKKPTVSLPSALDVLQCREGDCNEHTYLFVALARALGLPARINIGIVHAVMSGQTPAFYYHAWPSVFVGEWVEMDPTFGTPLVGAAYIRLTAGELSDQMKLMGVLGRLSVDIIE